jgi:hypothetical protein
MDETGAASLQLSVPRGVPEESSAHASCPVWRTRRGFLGIGGTRVSEDEQAALDEIAAALVSHAT